jgi:hypothetical protein
MSIIHGYRYLEGVGIPVESKNCTSGVSGPTYIISIASYVIILTYGTKERFTK